METSDGKQAERALERPKRSKNEAKKRSSAVWDHDAAGSNPVTPTENRRYRDMKILKPAAFSLYRLFSSLVFYRLFFQK